MELIIGLTGFVVLCLASNKIGHAISRFHLPLITGFLFAGILVGPFGLKLIEEKTIGSIHFLEQFSLAFIAFAAGGEIFLTELKDRINSIKWVTAGLVVSTFSISSTCVFFLSDLIPFMQILGTDARIAISILSGSILVARSPSSAIAIINQLRAKGPFTKTVLGVTVIMDAVVIILFALNSSIADALIKKVPVNFGLLLLLFLEMAFTLTIGILAGKLLIKLISLSLPTRIKQLTILLLGYGIFALSVNLKSLIFEKMALNILFEPLLICMIGGFYVTNYGTKRDEFLKHLSELSPMIYLCFFTYTGISLNIGILGSLWPIALLLFFIRVGTIFLGSLAGGLISGDGLKQSSLSWMAYITQAGIGIGLTREVAEQFPAWGAAFATLFISIIIINQIIGPIFFRWSLYILKEVKPAAMKTEEGIEHKVVIFGFDGQAFALARQLLTHNWRVIIAAPENATTLDGIEPPAPIHSYHQLNNKTLAEMGIASCGAVVTLLSDSDNYLIGQLLHQHFPDINIVVRLNDRTNYNKFIQIGALTVTPSTAIISLLDHFIRSPSLVSMLLAHDDNHDLMDLTIKNPYLTGRTLADLDLPEGLIIVSVHRHGEILNIYNAIHFQFGDKITICGPWEKLRDVSSFFVGQNYMKTAYLTGL